MIINYSFMTKLLTTTWQVFCFVDDEKLKEKISEICVIISAIIPRWKIGEEDVRLLGSQSRFDDNNLIKSLYFPTGRVFTMTSPDSQDGN